MINIRFDPKIIFIRTEHLKLWIIWSPIMILPPKGGMDFFKNQVSEVNQNFNPWLQNFDTFIILIVEATNWFWCQTPKELSVYRFYNIFLNCVSFYKSLTSSLLPCCLYFWKYCQIFIFMSLNRSFNTEDNNTLSLSLFYLFNLYFYCLYLPDNVFKKKKGEVTKNLSCQEN